MAFELIRSSRTVTNREKSRKQPDPIHLDLAKLNNFDTKIWKLRSLRKPKKEYMTIKRPKKQEVDFLITCN